jgi:HAE1 family hydrophobic/amphiphilic exporter-1
VNIASFFIHRPVFTLLLSLSFMIFGIFGYKGLPVGVLPDVDFPVIQVTASMPGASPETMASAVALPLEKQFSNIDGIDSMNSVSSTGITRITIQFNLERNIDGAALDVQSAISSAMRSLPSSMPSPPTFHKINPAMVPIVYMTLSSDTMKLSDIDYFASNVLAQRISSIHGVAQVQVLGAQTYALRVQLDPYKLKQLDMDINEIKNIIAQNNTLLPQGAIYGNERFAMINVPGILDSAQDYDKFILTYKNGHPIYLTDVGTVVDSVANNKIATFNNGKQVIAIAVQRQPNTNTVKIIDSIKQMLPMLKKEIPQGLNIRLVVDSSLSILESVSDVKHTMLIGLVLVVLVIYLFLQNIRSTVIASILMPISLIGTCALMHYCGFSINNISLLALTLSIGFIIDDAIVVIENINRHMEMGASKLNAALIGSKEIAFTVISMSVSLIAVFIPILFMEGIIGKMFNEFAVIICGTIAISGIIALSLSPMLCSLYMQTPSTQHSKNKFNVFFDYVIQQYKTSLNISLKHKKLSIAFFIATIFLTILFGKLVNKGFLPDSDSGKIYGSTEALQNISFEGMVKEQRKLDQVFLQNPYIQDYVSIIGITPTNHSFNSGTVYLVLKPRNERPSSFEILKDLRQKLKDIPGMNVYLHNIATITIGGLKTKSPYQFSMQSTDQDALYDFTKKLVEKLHEAQSITDVSSDMQLSQPMVKVVVDRNKATIYGLSMQDIQNALYLGFAEPQISTIYTPTAQYEVILGFAPQYQKTAASLEQIYIKSASGAMVPLASISSLIHNVGPLTIAHSMQMPSTTISFNVANGYALSDAVNEVEKISKALNMPGNILGDFQGTAKAFKSSSNSMIGLILLAIILLYIVLGMLYESFIHPFTILSGLPSAALGALFFLWILGKDLDLYGFVGLIMLIGIIKKNAIMIIDFALVAKRERKLSSEDAIIEASLIRFRPIMMTTAATIMGALPIAMAYGPTGHERSSLGVAIVGGLFFSQIITLYLTPVVFLYLESFSSWLMVKLPFLKNRS